MALKEGVVKMFGNDVGVREKTIEELIRDLANPELTKSGNEADRIISKIRDEKAMIAERNHHEMEKLLEENELLKTEIKAMAGYIRFKEW
jgi:DNA primase catalytic subunit